MNPNREPSHDESDDALDRAIRAAIAQPPPVELKHRVIERAAVFTPSSRALWWCARRRSWFLAASAAATVAAACVSALLMLPSSSVGWEDVTTAVKSQRWIARPPLGTANKARCGSHPSAGSGPLRGRLVHIHRRPPTSEVRVSRER